tara:strand:+ start:552 stop:1379 length:828 start_codon:yes stop_codon:yes gene_type:complete
MNSTVELSYGMRHIIGNTIKTAIADSGMSDIEIAQHLNVTRSTIYLWRNKRDAVIRKTNLVSLSKLLNKGIDYSKTGTVEFTDIAKIIKKDNQTEGLDMSQGMTERLIDTLTRQVDSLDLRVKELKSENVSLRESNRILTVNQKTADLTLDPSLASCIANVQSGGFHQITIKYAELFGYTYTEMLTTVKFASLIHKDDIWKLDPAIEGIHQKKDDPLITQYWKMIKKDGSIVYVSNINRILETDNLVQCILEETSEANWKEYSLKLKRANKDNIN